MRFNQIQLSKNRDVRLYQKQYSKCLQPVEIVWPHVINTGQTVDHCEEPEIESLDWHECAQ